MHRPDATPYPREQVTAGILAGGRATRMGGHDKGLLELAGRPMIEYVLDALRGQAARVVINANRSFEAYERYGVTVVRDRQDGFLGPLAGMAGMMAAVDTAWLLTAPCDSPQVPADLGPRLWQTVVRERADIGVADNGERLQPVFALLRCALLPELEACLAAGERKIDRFYRQQHMVAADFSDCPKMFVNVNTPAERDALAAELRHGAKP
ncbi:MAG: molybdenum cofactor guanylyltransferase [Rhodanobacter sp.]|nr:MAG: molybdenum cofactor guanylyltransferase [Rhodanobacter sp.]TAM39108.1 MAG: molybdenum cofactor guanylyltransferase [Rhodanobacter sp.]